MRNLDKHKIFGLALSLLAVIVVFVCGLKIYEKAQSHKPFLTVVPSSSALAVLEFERETNLPKYLASFFDDGLMLMDELGLSDVSHVALAILKGDELSKVWAFKSDNAPQSIFYKDYLSYNEELYYLRMVSDYILVSKNKKQLIKFGDFAPLSEVPEVQRFLHNSPKKNSFMSYLRADSWWINHLYGENSFIAPFAPVLDGLGGIGIIGESEGDKYKLKLMHALDFERKVPIIPSSKAVRLDLLEYIGNSNNQLVFLDSAFGDKFVQLLQHFRNQLPGLVSGVDEFRKAVYERVYVDVIDDVMQLMRDDYVLKVDLDSNAISLVSRVDENVYAGQKLSEVFEALQKYLPLSFPVEKDVVLRDGTKARWLIADPERELVDDSTQFGGIDISGLKFKGSFNYGFYGAVVGKVLMFSSNKDALIQNLESFLGGSSFLASLPEVNQEEGVIHPDSRLWIKKDSSMDKKGSTILSFVSELLDGYSSLDLSQITYRDDIITEITYY